MTREHLKTFIRDHCLKKNWSELMVNSPNRGGAWIFDLRPLVLHSEMLAFLAEEFWDRFGHLYPFQVSCRELAAVPLLGAIIAEGTRRQKPITGIIVRKSRKKTGLQKFVEGEVSNVPIILIDDLVNTGSSFQSQMLALGDASARIAGYFTVLRYRENEAYPFLQKNTPLHSLFCLTDFGVNLTPKQKKIPNSSRFEVLWKFESPAPNNSISVPKSGPALDEGRVFFGSDSGYFWAINQESGEVSWKYKTGLTIPGKRIFSTPIVHDGLVYFGAYDGNFYALNTKTGAPEWTARDADAIGASPALAKNLGLVFIGNEYGLFRKKGGAAAYAVKTGQKIWEQRFSEEYTHCSPAYSKKYCAIGIGSNDQKFYLLDAKTGEIRWIFQADGDIKGRPAFDEERGLALFGASDGILYVLDVMSGTKKGSFKTEGLVYATPLVHRDRVLFASEDRCLYSMNLDSGALEWKFTSAGRMMATPLIVDGHIFIGGNDGRFYELTEGGELIGYTQFLERITNQAAYNPKSGTFFITTGANQLFAIRKKATYH